MSFRWQKIDILAMESPPRWLQSTDQCYYAREFVSGGGYECSETNDLISNFKKPPSRKGKPEWYYKTKAVEQFAHELAALFASRSHVVACIPTSKTRDDPAYDSRLVDTLRLLQHHCPAIRLEFPITRDHSIRAKHEGGSRNPHSEIETLQWIGFDSVPDRLVLVDDMITSGSGFKACQMLVRQHYAKVLVCGVFWTRAIQRDNTSGQ